MYGVSMKKTVVFCILILTLSLLCATYSSNTVSIKEEIGYNSYNNVGSYSNTNNSYSVNSISSNTVIENDVNIMFDDGVGVAFTGGLGYQKDIYCFNRFASIPSNINGKALFGVYYSPLDGIDILVSGGLRTSYLLSKSNWVSQVGGEVSVGYYFGFGLSFNLSSSFWYNTNYRSIICGVGVGYRFGGER